jgi:hypothetical protein
MQDDSKEMEHAALGRTVVVCPTRHRRWKQRTGEGTCNGVGIGFKGGLVSPHAGAFRANCVGFIGRAKGVVTSGKRRAQVRCARPGV